MHDKKIPGETDEWMDMDKPPLPMGAATGKTFTWAPNDLSTEWMSIRAFDYRIVLR